MKNSAFKNFPIWHYLLILLVLVANRVGFDVSGGEEQYLAFAREFINPDWIPNSFTLTEFAGSRIVFQYMVGPWLEWFSFETMVFAFRFIAFLFMAIPLSYIFKKFNFSLLATFIAVQVFVLTDQNLIGGEWIIKSFEPKAIAYVFVFAAIASWLYEKPFVAVVFLALATYFHVLVGGWILLVLLLSVALNGKWLLAIKSGLLFALVTSPIVIYMFFGYVAAENPVTDYNLNNIYCYHRLPHHLGIWKTTEYFMKGNALGSVFTLVILVLVVGFKKQFSARFIGMRSWVIIIFSINLLFVLVAAMDHFFFENSGGFGLMYYPFRTNSIGLFFVVVLAVAVLFEKLEMLKSQLRVKQVLWLGIIALFVAQTNNNIQRSRKYFKRDPAFMEMCAFVKAETPKNSVFMLSQPDFNSSQYNSFGRRAERENFSVPKFVSAEKSKLLEWYLREEDYIKIRGNAEKALELGPKYGLTHLISTFDQPKESFELLHTSGEYFLYRIKY